MIIRPTARRIAIILIAMMILNLSPIFPIHSVIPVHAAATPELLIAPSHQDLATCTGTPSCTVTFNVNVSNISPNNPMADWSVVVRTNSDVLNPVSFTLGSFLAGAAESTHCINAFCTVGSTGADDGPGVVNSVAYSGTGNGNSGNGTLFSITYAAVGRPYTLVSFLGLSSETFVDDTAGIHIAIIAAPGDYGIVPPLSVANFTFSPQQPFVGEPVAFNASISTPAPGHTITDYLWSFISNGVPLRIPLTNHTFTQEGNVTVSLVVEDDRGLGFLSRPFFLTVPVIQKPLISLSIVKGLSIYPKDNIIPGGIVSITVLVSNLGTVPETGFNVSVSVANENFTALPYTAVVPQNSQGTVPFTWNTTGLVPDVYTVHAHLSPVPGENVTSDNDAYGYVRLIYPYSSGNVSVSISFVQLLGIGFLALIAVGVFYSVVIRIRDRRLAAKQDAL